MSEVQEFELLARFLAQSRVAVAFTGAGISTECGIPDFRSKNSAWARNPPMPLGDFLASEANQIESWRRKFAMDDLRRDVKPGRGHRALARLFECGPLTGIITQNIDGLHQAAGVADTEVVELHGNGGHALCVACGVRLELSRVRADFEASGRAPRCECGGVVKSGTISFGQAMPRDAMARARDMARNCDLMIAIGSSLVVYPAAGFPLLAKQAGARLAILNRDPTPFDDHADLVLRGDIGTILAPLAAV